jgi:hypothetical protein
MKEGCGSARPKPYGQNVHVFGATNLNRTRHHANDERSSCLRTFELKKHINASVGQHQVRMLSFIFRPSGCCLPNP